MSAPASPAETREQLEQEAEAARARLESSIDEVMERGRHVVDVVENVKTQAKRHAPTLLALGAAALVITVVVAIRRRARARQRERREIILQLAGSLLRPGYSVQPLERPPGFLKSSLQNAGKQLLTAVAHEAGRRALASVSLVPVAAPTDGRAGTQSTSTAR